MRTPNAPERHRNPASPSSPRRLYGALLATLAAAALIACAGVPEPGTPDPGTPDPGTPDPGTPDPAAIPYLFGADDGTHGFEPWLTDGTPEGTAMLADVRPGPDWGSDMPWIYFVLENGTVFNAREPSGDGVTLYVTDGTEAGTEPIAERVAFISGYVPQYAAFQIGDVVVFNNDIADPGTAGLYRTDGTAVGTVRLGDYLEGFFTGVRVPQPPAHLRHQDTDGAVFVVYDDTLWRVDATGAAPLHTFTEQCNQIWHLGVLGTALYFNASDPYDHPVTGLPIEARCELWRYDTAGDDPPSVHRAFTIMPDQSSMIRGFAERDGWLYYMLTVWDTSDPSWEVVTRQLRATNGGPAPSDSLIDDEGDVVVAVDTGTGFAFLQRAPDEAIYLYGSTFDTDDETALVRLHGEIEDAWIEVVDPNLADTSFFGARFTWVGNHLVYQIAGPAGGLYSVENGTSDVVELVSGADALVWNTLMDDRYNDRLFAWFDETAEAAGVPGGGGELVTSLYVTDGTLAGTARIATFCYQVYYGCE